MKNWKMEIQATAKVKVKADNVDEAIKEGIRVIEDYLKNGNYLNLHDFKVDKKTIEVEDEEED